MKRLIALVLVFCLCLGWGQMFAEEMILVSENFEDQEINIEDSFLEEDFLAEESPADESDEALLSDDATLYNEDLANGTSDEETLIMEEFQDEAEYLVISDEVFEEDEIEIEVYHADNEETLEEGATGDAVLTLQQELYQLGYLAAVPDGWFGSYTKKAVKIFQMFHELPITGTADRATLTMLQSGQANAFSSLYNGSYGNAVTAMQQLLIDLGYLTVPADGGFGNFTENAVKKFQEENDLIADGVAGLFTLNALVELLPARGTQQIPADETLTVGSAGDTVLLLQQRLSSLGYLNAGADGWFGEKTQKAVQKFQMYQGLPITGSADELTIEILNEGNCVAFTFLYLEQQSRAVANLQEMLANLGYLTVAPDGVFGSYTYQAVAAFQADNGLAADGIAGFLTLDVLLDNPVALLKNDGITRELSVGMEGEEVLKLQQKLRSLGYLYYNPDGIYGMGTQEAVRMFQVYQNLPVTGTADQTTIDAMYAESAEEFHLLQKGNTGSAVRGLQQLLIAQGYLHAAADGIYGTSTRSAVRLFQLENGLLGDGSVGFLTLHKLLNDPVPYSEGMEDDYPELNVENYGNDNGRLLITWSAISKADGYYVYRSRYENSGFELINVTETACKYIDWALDPGTTYYYKILAFAGSLEDVAGQTMLAESDVVAGTTSSYGNQYYWTNTSVWPNVFNTVSVSAVTDEAAQEIYAMLEKGSNFYIFINTSDSSQAYWTFYGLKKKVSTLNEEGIGMVSLSSFYSDGGYYYLIDAETFTAVQNYIAMAYAERMEEYGIYLENNGSDEYFYDYHSPDSYDVRYVANYRDSLFEAEYGAKFTEMSTESQFLFTTPGTNMVVRTDYMVFDLRFNTVGETALDILYKMSKKTAIGVCRHFALAVDTICDYLDVQCWTPVDYGYNHQWAIVKANDNDGNVVWYLVDNQNVVQLKSEDDLKYRPVEDMIWDYSRATRQEMGSAYPF